MPTPTKGPRLGGGPAHEKLMLANLATALFEHGRITTTVTKAKRVRPLAERLITFAKRGDLHGRRQVLTVVRDKSVVHTLFAEIGPRFENRPGGYTRITKIGPRKGDNAPMAVIELVEPLTVAQQAVGEAERARGTRFARRGGAAENADTTENAGTTESTEDAEQLAVSEAQTARDDEVSGDVEGAVDNAALAEDAAEIAGTPAAESAAAAADQAAEEAIEAAESTGDDAGDEKN